MGPAVQLVPMAEHHLAAIAALEAQCSALPWSMELFAGELTLSSAVRHWLVATLNGEVIGFGGMMLIDDETHLMNIAVDPSLRRSGIARWLLAHLIIDVVARGVRHLTLEVRVDNDAAIAMYRQFGLAPVGTRPDYYGPGQHALILWADDIDRPDYQTRMAEFAAAAPYIYR